MCVCVRERERVCVRAYACVWVSERVKLVQANNDDYIPAVPIGLTLFNKKGCKKKRSQMDHLA